MSQSSSSSSPLPLPSPSPSPSPSPPLSSEYISILVHNVSHHDMLFSILAPQDISIPSSSTDSPPAPFSPPIHICRPKFHRYFEFTSFIQKEILKKGIQKLIPFYAYSLHYKGNQLPYGWTFNGKERENTVDWDLDSFPSFPHWSGMKLKSKSLEILNLNSQSQTQTQTQMQDTQTKFNNDMGTSSSSSLSLSSPSPSLPHLFGVYFPILSTLIPRWLKICHAKSFVLSNNGNQNRNHLEKDKDNDSSSSPSSSSSSSPSFSHQMILYLISGGGTPWDPNLSSEGNSTYVTAQLCQMFLSFYYPQLKVIIQHSADGLFHYDSNVEFVNRQLRVEVESYRQYLSNKYYEKWSKYLHITISLTDGASARIGAISAALRHFRPDTLHMWQLKSFWHEFPFITGKGEDDVQFHEFDKIEMTPPTLVSDTEGNIKSLVKELLIHKNTFETIRDSSKYNELGLFWLRKSRQPVLSVLMIQKKNDLGQMVTKFYRGINMEVSMPTGSLCSERNAIGSALANDPSLRRKDMKMIAVLALPLHPQQREGEDAEKKTETYKKLVSNWAKISADQKKAAESSNDKLYSYQYHQPEGQGQCQGQGHARGNSNPLSNQRKHSHADADDSTSPFSPLQLSSSSSSSSSSSISFSFTSNLQNLNQSTLSTQGDQNNTFPLKSSSSSSSPSLLSSQSLSSPSPSLSPPSPHSFSPNSKRKHSHVNEISPIFPSSRGERKRQGKGNNHDHVQDNDKERRSVPMEIESSCSASLSFPSFPLPLPLPSDINHENKEKLKILRNSPEQKPHQETQRKRTKPMGKENEKDHDQEDFAQDGDDDGDNATNSVLPPSHSPSLSLSHSPSLSPPSSPLSLSEKHRLLESELLYMRLRREHLVGEDEGRNPIAPCGSCNEWLRKIAEVNTEFKVITFTQTDCKVCFVKQVMF